MLYILYLILNLLIRNIPFFAKGLALDDLILVEEIDNKLVYKKTVNYSGNSTYRVFTNSDLEGFDFLWKILEGFGCTYERGTKNLYAINVPPSCDIFKVYEILELGEKRKIWEFDEGFCGHPSIFTE